MILEHIIYIRKFQMRPPIMRLKLDGPISISKIELVIPIFFDIDAIHIMSSFRYDTHHPSAG